MFLTGQDAAEYGLESLVGEGGGDLGGGGLSGRGGLSAFVSETIRAFFEDGLPEATRRLLEGARGTFGLVLSVFSFSTHPFLPYVAHPFPPHLRSQVDFFLSL